MSRPAKNGTTGAIDGQGKLATSSSVDTAVNAGVAQAVHDSGNMATEAPLDTGLAATIDWQEPQRRLLAERDAARIELADAHRLLAEAKAQRNAAMDEIMLLRAQLKVAVEDGNAGWAAASAARGPTH